MSSAPPRPVVVRPRRKRRAEDGLKLNELIILRALDRGATQASVSHSRHYSRSGIAAMLRRLRVMHGVESTPDLLCHPLVRAQLDRPHPARWAGAYVKPSRTATANLPGGSRRGGTDPPRRAAKE